MLVDQLLGRGSERSGREFRWSDITTEESAVGTSRVDGVEE